MAGNSPCWHCEREWKCATCHIDCPDYTKWAEINERVRNEQFKIRETENGIYTQQTKSVLKAMKHRRK